MGAASEWIVHLRDTGRDQLARVGGKGANLGEMVRAGLPVPPGFCVTTSAFARFLELALADDPALHAALEELDALDPDDIDGARARGQSIRARLEAVEVPPEIREALAAAVREAGEQHAYAVRSSATTEDLPDASFAGQQDTYLNVRGLADIVTQVRACWASLYTDRAILYRRRSGFATAGARLAVVVQRLVVPEVSGILFTADPISGDRRICSIDASYGLGEALVSGLVNADLYRLRKDTGALVEVRVGDKAREVRALPEGGTELCEVPVERRRERVLDDDALARLRALALEVETHQGSPQDIEWCVADGALYLLQTRPITSLFPLPVLRGAPADDVSRVFISFGHLQVMTAPVRPMAISVFRRVIPFGKARLEDESVLLATAGGRIFLDATAGLLRFPMSRILPALLSNMDPAISGRMITVRDRPEFRAGRSRAAARLGTIARVARLLLGSAIRRLLSRKPETARADFERAITTASDEWSRTVDATAPGAPRLRVLRDALARLFHDVLFAIFPPIVVAGMIAWKLVGRLVRGRVDEREIQALTRGFDGNATTEMDLALGDLADLAREHPPVRAVLEGEDPRAVIAELREMTGAERFIAGWDRFIAAYGHRGPGEIDITNTRWAEDPSSLVRALAGMLHDERPGEHRRRHAAARAEAERAAAAITTAAGRGLLGFIRRPLVRALIRRTRAYLALREHGKFLAMCLFHIAHRSLLEAGELAVSRGLLDRAEDVWMLELDELIAALERDGAVALRELVAERRAAYERYEKLSPPPVLTSDGEIPPMPDRGESVLPAGVLAGVSASAGIVEGTARVIFDPAREVLRAGEILVAPFTDPGWTPLFVHARGLVMEVGGLMTHGSVVAREYGIPAVVGIPGVTSTITTGQRIRVDGDRGRVTLLLDEDTASGADVGEHGGRA